MLAPWEAAPGLTGYRVDAPHPLAAVLLVHGYAEHAGRHERTMRRFAERGITTFSYDQRGHGRSPGARAFIERFEALVDDAAAMRGAAARAAAGVPLFLFGASMGGLVAIRSVEQSADGLAGLVLVAPALRIDHATPAIVRALAPFAAALVPRTPAARLDVRLLSRNPSVGAGFLADPLTSKDGVTVRSAHEMVRGGVAALVDASRVALPLLIVHGDEDAIAAIAGSQLFLSAVGSGDATLRSVPGGFHEPFTDPGGDALVDETAEWILARAGLRADAS
ncbi:hydrolase [Vulcanimicrobium alpinum]|uniref:Hydrolase n=1 Tax=Vulcanimicrobium alpinum TaxID=3016050 RepID=A0AAN2C8V6_UNVUL|nr:alpha/beta hydrolase [Vulcanimicrobium alpinum]BDE04947.1 hydrolase [Vulcanimicrobium alpinum]